MGLCRRHANIGNANSPYATPAPQSVETQYPEAKPPETLHEATHRPETQYTEVQPTETQYSAMKRPETQYPEAQPPKTQYMANQRPSSEPSPTEPQKIVGMPSPLAPLQTHRSVPTNNSTPRRVGNGRGRGGNASRGGGTGTWMKLRFTLQWELSIVKELVQQSSSKNGVSFQKRNTCHPFDSSGICYGRRRQMWTVLYSGRLSFSNLNPLVKHRQPFPELSCSNPSLNRRPKPA